MHSLVFLYFSAKDTEIVYSRWRTVHLLCALSHFAQFFTFVCSLWRGHHTPPTINLKVDISIFATGTTVRTGNGVAKEQFLNKYTKYCTCNRLRPQQQKQVNTLPVKTGSLCDSSCLFELLHRLLWPEHKLQWNVFAVAVRSPAGAQNVLRDFLQRGRADDPRATQSGHDLVLQQPANLRQQAKTQGPK